MIILGLGTNAGDRLSNLRRALSLIKSQPKISVKRVSPIYLSDALLPDDAPADWNAPYLNLALACETTLDPFSLLHTIKELEQVIGRKPFNRPWGPRVIDIDILAYENVCFSRKELTLPHAELLNRPFALWPLSDVAPLWFHPDKDSHKTASQLAEKWGSRFTGAAPFRTKQILQRADTPQLMGIINVTPDSFSDGNQFLTPEKALSHAIQLVNEGATVLDIGAEATSPNAKALDEKTEWQRLKPILEGIQTAQKHFLIKPTISIDTRHASVALNALTTFDVDWINDVSGLDDPAMQDLIISSQKECVIMHHLSIPANRYEVLPSHLDPLEYVYQWALKRVNELEQKGIPKEKIIFDPGIGFGKTAQQSLFLIRHIHEFKQLGTRLLIGHSRKTFLSLLTEDVFHERDTESLALSLRLKEVDFLRVHNVHMNAKGFKAYAMSLPDSSF